MSLLDSAGAAVELARGMGAEQVKSWISTGVEVELQQRQGKLERVHESSTLGLSVSLMVDGKYSSHGTSDLRPGALKAFLQRAVDGTRYLEQDLDRTMLPFEEMGSLDPASLDNDDAASITKRGPQERQQAIKELEDGILAGSGDDLVSATSYLWEVRSESAAVFSNGFQATQARTHYGQGGMVTLKEPSGKLPESYSFFNASHFEDVPSVAQVSTDLWTKAGEVRNTSQCPSGKYTMILDRRVASRILGAMISPMSGGNLHTGRSMYLDKLGKTLGSKAFTLVDDPTIARGMGSKPFDGDGRKARVRPLFTEGRLDTYLLDLYHARKLKMEPTTGGTSNVIMQPGSRSWQEIAKEHGRAIRVTSFLGGNSNPASGAFSLGIRGQLIENGEVVQNLSEMNVSGNLLELMASFVEASNDPWLFASYRVPTLAFEGVQFSGS